MKKLQCFIFLVCSAFFFLSGCTEKDTERLDLIDLNSKLDTIKFEHSMKGWELYSWTVNSKWKYSLMPGTNSLKTFSLISNNYISVIGEDSLKVLLGRLPVNEEVYWIGGIRIKYILLDDFGDIKLPPRNIQIEIKEFCDTHQIQLTIID